MSTKLSQFKTDVHNDWCPGCGDFGILNAIQMALAELDIPRHKSVVFSGIGCAGKTSHFINVTGMHVPHGRLLTYAQGAKLSNPELTVIGTAGDGDGLGIGAGHFVAAGRRNVDMTYIVFDNGVYGLTKGQASPTLKLGLKTKSLPTPNINDNVNPISIALSSGFTFIARGYSYSVKNLKDLIIKAVKHKGLSFINVLQPCPTYNDINTKDWFEGADNIDEDTGKKIPRTYNLADTNYDGTVYEGTQDELNEKITQAMVKSLEWNDKIPIGVFYQNENVSVYSDRLQGRISNYLESPPAVQQIESKGKPNAEIDNIVESMRV